MLSFSCTDLHMSIRHNLVMKRKCAEMEFEQEEQLAAFCVDHLFWQKEAKYVEFGEDCQIVCSINRVKSSIQKQPEGLFIYL